MTPRRFRPDSSTHGALLGEGYHQGLSSDFVNHAGYHWFWALVVGICEFGGGLLFALGLFRPLGSLGIAASMLTAIAKGSLAENLGDRRRP